MQTLRLIPFLIWMIILMGVAPLDGQILQGQDSVPAMIISTGWADEAVAVGYVTAPTVLGLMFVSGLVNEWNAGYFGIPASALILAIPPAIYLGGRSVNILKEISHPRAKLGWTLYALSIIPTSIALYSYTTDWGATVPLIITSGIFGSASIIAMTAYAGSRAETARQMQNSPNETSWNFGIAPLKGGALASVTFRF
jgi:hypothetical protein